MLKFLFKRKFCTILDIIFDTSVKKDGNAAFHLKSKKFFISITGFFRSLKNSNLNISHSKYVSAKIHLNITYTQKHE